MERTVYDPETGQLVSGSFMDYAIPRADDVPTIDFQAQLRARPHQSAGGQGCGRIRMHRGLSGGG